MIRPGNSSGGIIRVLRSYKSYLFVVLVLYLLVILVFHAQLHVYDGIGTTARSRPGVVESSLLNTSRSSPQPLTSHRTPSRSTSTTTRFRTPKVSDREQRSMKDSDRAFPLITDCFPSSPTNPGLGRDGLSFQRIEQHYVYSAYFDNRLIDDPPTIRIIALLKKSNDFHFYCHIPVASENALGTDSSPDSHGSTNGRNARNQSSTGVNKNSKGTGGYSEVQGDVKGNGGYRRSQYYLNVKYGKAKNNADSLRDNLNIPRLKRGSNTRIGRNTSSSNPVPEEHPENRSGYQWPNDNTDGQPTKHRRRIESDLRLRYLTVRASVYEMCENHNKDFGGWILSCRLDRHIQLPPCEVFVSMSHSRTQPNASMVSIPVFRVRNTDTIHRMEEFGVCVPPLFGHIPSTTLVEFVEFSRILGADHFVFYHHQVSREISKALSYYANRGTVTTIRWDLPVDDKSVWYHGQLLAINDCLYRSMHAFRHVAFNDIDEFVVPHIHLTWKEMVSSFQRYILGPERTTLATVALEKSSSPSEGLRRGLVPSEGQSHNFWPLSEPGQGPQPSESTQHGPHPLGELTQVALSPNNGIDYAGYSFQSAFFDPLLSGLISHVMYDLESDLRTKTFSRVRSKVMVRPVAIFELGIHHVSRLVSEDLEVYHVPTDVAFVHHYRKCISEFDPLMSCQIFAHDESLSRYIPTIRHNIHQTLWRMKEASQAEKEYRAPGPTAFP